MALLARAAIAATIILAWELASGGIVPGYSPLQPALVGRPSLVARELVMLVANGSIFANLAITLSEALLGLAFGVTIGATLGVLLARSALLATLFLPYLSVLNSLPRLALAPFLITAFGLGLASKVIVAMLMTLFAAFFTTFQGVRQVDAELVRAVRGMGANDRQVLRHVVLPSVVAWVLAGVRTSLGLALVGAIIGEYIGATAGLGYQLTAATGALNGSRAVAILVVLAATGLVLDAGARAVEARLLRWRPAASLAS